MDREPEIESQRVEIWKWMVLRNCLRRGDPMQHFSVEGLSLKAPPAQNQHDRVLFLNKTDRGERSFTTPLAVCGSSGGE